MSSDAWTAHFTSIGQGRIHHVEAGDGEPLVLLHATGSSAFQWRHVMQQLARKWRVLAPDIPGHGDSAPITAHASIRDHALAILDWMSALGLDRPALSGNSVGGCICLSLASEFAERISRAVFVETPLRTDAQWAAGWPSAERYFNEVSTPIDVLKTRFRDVSPELHERWNIDRNKAGARNMMDAVRAIRKFDAIEALGKLRVPCAAILGERGPVKDGLPLWRDALPAGRVVEIADAGHFPMIEAPGAFSAALARLLID